MPLFTIRDFYVFFSKRECANTVPIFPIGDFYIFRREKKTAKVRSVEKSTSALEMRGFAKEGFFGEKKTSFGVKRL